MSETNDNPGDDAAVSAPDPIALSADIVAAYIAHNSLPVGELAGLIARVHQAVVGLGSGSTLQAQATAPEVDKPTPAQIRKSVTEDGIVSFLDGKTYKTLKRHLGVNGFDPRAYRDRYGLPSDYPMVAPSYAAQRSALAKSIGLGRPGGLARSEAPNGEPAPEAAPAVEAAPAPKRRGRKAA